MRWGLCERKLTFQIWRSFSLWHCATSRKVAGSIPCEVIGFFILHNPFWSSVALGSTQPLTEMSTRDFPGDKGLPARKADNLTSICERIVQKCGSLYFPQHYGLPRPVTRIALPFNFSRWLPGGTEGNHEEITDSQSLARELGPVSLKYEARFHITWLCVLWFPASVYCLVRIQMICSKIDVCMRVYVSFLINVSSNSRLRVFPDVVYFTR
jgi:hypothetical protein